MYKKINKNESVNKNNTILKVTDKNASRLIQSDKPTLTHSYFFATEKLQRQRQLTQTQF